ncbi:hypothetical protein HanHA300_Chr09g0324511 [Helianthus annuus]|nr:hypothetical protein HanHA300_Chr09g0324511 [Helianthus annuus]KAJ0542950.1 hypothetical protein HanHA89_Chr09g0345461 [Helianthus annuus]KAJ0708005.1 hypothetical protein HanLR1_Chr09g0324791 [Helianthus annuus]KAJ0711973.1 hypothetical protein HanOQP8_Chr09g0329821 [Helianthus annuus]
MIHWFSHVIEDKNSIFSSFLVFRMILFDLQAIKDHVFTLEARFHSLTGALKELYLFVSDAKFLDM